MMIDLYKMWPVIFAIFGVFAWNIRLEAKVLYMEREQKRKSIADQKIADDIVEIKLSIARIEEHFKIE